MHHPACHKCRSATLSSTRRMAGAVRKSTGTAVAGSSLFWRGPGGATPAPNPDAQQLLPVFQYLPHVFEQRAWTPDEKDVLKDAIQQIVQVWPAEARQGVRTPQPKCCLIARGAAKALMASTGTSLRPTRLNAACSSADMPEHRCHLQMRRFAGGSHCSDTETASLSVSAGGGDEQTPGRDHVLERRHGR